MWTSYKKKIRTVCPIHLDGSLLQKNLIRGTNRKIVEGRSIIGKYNSPISKI